MPSQYFPSVTDPKDEQTFFFLLPSVWLTLQSHTLKFPLLFAVGLTMVDWASCEKRGELMFFALSLFDETRAGDSIVHRHSISSPLGFKKLRCAESGMLMAYLLAYYFLVCVLFRFYDYALFQYEGCRAFYTWSPLSLLGIYNHRWKTTHDIFPFAKMEKQNVKN